MKKRYASVLPVGLALLLVFYCGLYVASVMDGQFAANPDPRYMRSYTVSQWVAAPYYRGFPSLLQGGAQVVFAPVHYLDRRYFRPGKWAGRILTPAVAPVVVQKASAAPSLAPSSSPKPRAERKGKRASSSGVNRR